MARNLRRDFTALFYVGIFQLIVDLSCVPHSCFLDSQEVRL
jgi:hypothetical protein